MQIKPSRIVIVISDLKTEHKNANQNIITALSSILTHANALLNTRTKSKYFYNLANVKRSIFVESRIQFFYKPDKDDNVNHSRIGRNLHFSYYCRDNYYYVTDLNKTFRCLWWCVKNAAMIRDTTTTTWRKRKKSKAFEQIFITKINLFKWVHAHSHADDCWQKCFVSLTLAKSARTSHGLSMLLTQFVCFYFYGS